MSTQEAAYALLERALNLCLRMDPDGLRRLSSVYGRVICIQVLGLGLELWMVPGPDGIQVFPDMEGPADCVLRGTPLALAGLGDRERGSDPLFRGEVEIRGDTETAHRFGEALGALDIDWEEQLSRFTGDPIAHQAGQGVRAGGRWAARSGGTLLRDLEEYLHEEARLLPTRYEVEAWQAEVETLRDDTERLAARLRRLHRRAGDTT
jgi:ubiquinone biosynthesis protein UbiJ